MKPGPVLALLLAAMPLAAHHSPAAEYDINKVVQIQGVVADVRWLNPHASFLLDVTGTDGKVVRWAVELPAPAHLVSQGYTRKDIAPGDRITVGVWVAKNGSFRADARSVTLADGRTMSGASRWDPPYTFSRK